jgi:hypothetical protein
LGAETIGLEKAVVSPCIDGRAHELKGEAAATRLGAGVE